MLIDFLIRHGHIRPEHPDYSDLVLGLWRVTVLGTAMQARTDHGATFPGLRRRRLARTG